MSSNMKALKRCIRERKMVCQSTHKMLAEAYMVVEMLKSASMEIDDVWFAADLMDNILDQHKYCVGHYARGDQKRNDNANREAQELDEAVEWLRTERGDFRKKEKQNSDWLLRTAGNDEEEVIKRAIEDFGEDGEY